jgi:predicted nucleic acid-binding Zn ribbon protein
VTIIKCIKCGKPVPEGALYCPNCGKAVSTNFLLLKERASLRKTILISITIFCLIGFSTFIFFSLKLYFTEIETSNKELITSSLNKPTPAASLTVQITDDGKKVYPIQYNNLWGHEFYTGKIDKTGNIDIGPAAKQILAKLFNALDFPTKLTKNLAIINIDKTFEGSTILIKIPWIEGISAFAIVQQLEGGLYGTLADGAVIFLNNLVGYDLAVLTHELGHQISYYLTDEEWYQYYKLRGIPTNTPIRSFANWGLSPEEDFAEVFKATYKSAIVGSSEYSMVEDRWNIKTKYGFFVPTKYTYSSSCDPIEENVISGLLKTWEKNTVSYQMNSYLPPSDIISKLEDQISADPKVQNCRKKSNELNPFGGPAFISEADAETQQFIKNVLIRLNSM